MGLVLLVIWLAGMLAQSLVAFIPPSADVHLGKASWDQLAPPERQCQSPEIAAYVKSLADTLTPHFNTPFEFQFRVVDSEEVNAFALPGGFVTINLGLLRKADSGDEVAAVVGHEMAHVSERHGTKRILRQLGGMAVLSAIFGGTDIEAPAYVLGGLANTAYDRDQEAQADEIGRRALIDAGISPVGMVRFFERMATEAGPTPPQLLSTHPDPGNRAQAAREAADGFTPSRSLPSPRGLSCH